MHLHTGQALMQYICPGDLRLRQQRVATAHEETSFQLANAGAFQIIGLGHIAQVGQIYAYRLKPLSV